MPKAAKGIIMRLPSIASMVKANIPQPEKCRSRMEQCREYYRCNPLREVRVENCLTDLSVIMGGFGPQYIPRGSNKNSPSIAYVNMGDTYDTTIMFINGNFVVGNWGSIVERGNYK